MIEDIYVQAQEVYGMLDIQSAHDMLRGTVYEKLASNNDYDISGNHDDISRRLEKAKGCENGQNGEYIDRTESFLYSHTLTASGIAAFSGMVSGFLYDDKGEPCSCRCAQYLPLYLKAADSNYIKIGGVISIFITTGISMSRNIHTCIDTATHVSVTQWLLGAVPLIFSVIEYAVWSKGVLGK